MRKENDKLNDTLMQIANALREKRSHKYNYGWDIYKHKAELACEAGNQYMNLELTEKQREVIDKMMELQADAYGCELTLNYIAGLLDGIVFFRDLDLLDMFMMDNTAPDGSNMERDRLKNG